MYSVLLAPGWTRADDYLSIIRELLLEEPQLVALEEYDVFVLLDYELDVCVHLNE